MRWRPCTKGRTDRGAAAVEFALIVPILFVLLFGIIDYGAVFSDSVSMRQGVREAARAGVVSSFNSSCGSATTMATVQCRAKDEIGTMSGTPAVKVYAPNGWVKGEELIVCARLDDPGLIELVVPLPDTLTSRVTMSIETEDAPPTGAMSAADSGDWAWC
ncbi:hypothetical protein Pve01_89490 [Planomonospora venezuelensis]|nr:hypothetical protein Pve01_89490 [Planomonospora venezuelensis]